MRRFWTTAVVVVSIGVVPVAAQQQTFSVPSCSYMNDAANKFADGPCLMRTSEVNGKFAYTLTFGDGTRVVVEYVASQSGYHIWRINGQSGFGVEVNRQHVKGATLDLKQTVEWDSSSPLRR